MVLRKVTYGENNTRAFGAGIKKSPCKSLQDDLLDQLPTIT